jgi:outer membrane protein OmpA-like peptidoglycan-associated protein
VANHANQRKSDEEDNAMRTIVGWTLLGAIALSTRAGAEDCDLGQRYLSLAKDRIAAYANDEALVLLRQSVEACPAYDAYEQLGELAAQSPQREDKTKAVGAFVSAHALAPTPRARAWTLYQYAALLNREGDPQNAYPLIKEARALDSTNPDIATLAGIVETQVQHPTQEHIVRALHYSLYQPLAPLRLAAVSPAAMRGSAGATGGSARAASREPVAAPAPSGPSVNIPINFNTASTVVDRQTGPNVELLAHSLADPSLDGRQFTFIGHSDSRGGDQFNVSLSLQRAQAISQMVSTLEPTLKGRILVEGHGAREPIDLGSDENAMRANRRLQVLVR